MDQCQCGGVFANYPNIYLIYRVHVEVTCKPAINITIWILNVFNRQ